MTPISLIIPAYNEEGSIKSTILKARRVLGAKSEIIVVDDGSTDATYSNTKAVARSAKIKIIRHPENRGKAHAIYTGIKHGKFRIFATTDADESYPLEALPQLVGLLEKENADMVIGSRFMGKWGVENMPVIRYIGNKLLYLWVSLLLGRQMTDSGSGLRVWRRRVTDALDIKARSLEFEVEMTSKAILSGFKVLEIPIDFNLRAGKSKLRLFEDGLLFFKTAWDAKFSGSGLKR